MTARPTWMTARKDGVSLTLRVKPGARRTCIKDRSGDALALDVAAPPVEGSANAEVIAFVAKTLGVRKNQCELMIGERSRQKVIWVHGIAPEEAQARLSEAR